MPDHITIPTLFLTAFRFSILDEASSHWPFPPTCWARRSTAMPTFTTERRYNCPSARIIDSVGVYPFRLIGLDTLRRPGA